MKYIICWRYIPTGYEGRGTLAVSKEIGMAWLEYLSKSPDTENWLEASLRTSAQYSR